MPRSPRLAPATNPMPTRASRNGATNISICRIAMSRAAQERAAREGRYPDMSTANIHDRGAIERVYSCDAYASDASQNERRKPAVLKGVRITEAADQAGNFAIEPAASHAGEVPGAV